MNSNKEQVADAIDKLMFQDGEMKSHDAVTIINLLTKLLKETETKNDDAEDSDDDSDDESNAYIRAMHAYESQRPFTEARQIRENTERHLSDTNHLTLLNRLFDQSVGRNMDLRIPRDGIDPVYPANDADVAFFLNSMGGL